jgi:hypothetical protein
MIPQARLMKTFFIAMSTSVGRPKWFKMASASATVHNVSGHATESYQTL